MKEQDIQRQILDYLALRKIFCYRQNSGAFIDKSKRFYRFTSMNGLPDIVCVIDGVYTGIEVKKPNGKQSSTQKEFQKRLEDVGGRCILAYSLEDVQSVV